VIILLIRTSSVLLSQNVLFSITDYQLMFILPYSLRIYDTYNEFVLSFFM